MKIQKFIGAVAAVFFLAGCATTKIQNNYENKTAEQILSEMTTEEKVGQLFVIQPDQLDPSFGKKGFKYHRNFSHYSAVRDLFL